MICHLPVIQIVFADGDKKKQKKGNTEAPFFSI